MLERTINSGPGEGCDYEIITATADEQEERIPTFIPGDELVYQLVFICTVNVSTVTATFRNETTGDELTLTGEAHMIAKPKVLGARTHAALLHYNHETSDEPATGRYRLARLEARTYGGKALDFDNPVEDAFRFEEEPEDIELPKIARGLVEPATVFVLPEGHPNKPTRPGGADLRKPVARRTEALRDH